MLVPIIKDKCGEINSKDNYRPIALVSIVSKIVENILLDRMSVTLSTSPISFDLKKHGTDLCIYLLKEVIDRHRSLNGSMLTCFWMLLKSVKHSILFKMVIERGVPVYIM